MDEIAVFPLCWPDGWARTKNPQPNNRFTDRTVYAAWKEVKDELDKFGANRVLISTNVEVRVRDLVPLQKDPIDKDYGVAVYFVKKQINCCIPCDQFTSVSDNLHAIALSIEALRKLERYGTAQIFDAAFKGFQALPASSSFLEVLGNPKTLADAEANYKKLALEHHPDHGGDPTEMIRINEAIAVARAHNWGG